MSVYVGIDVHRKRSQVAVIDQSGEVLANRDVPSGVEPILKVIGGLPPGTPAAFEAAFGTGWLVELLEDYGFTPHLVHPSRCKAIASARLKNDKVDAAILAQLLRADLLPEAWIAPPAVRQLRALLRHRASLVRLGTQLRNRIHAVVADVGYDRPGSWVRTLTRGSDRACWRTSRSSRSMTDSRASMSARASFITSAEMAGRSREAGHSRPGPLQRPAGRSWPWPARTAWIRFRSSVRSRTSWIRCRSSARSWRTSSGAIHASGSRSARSSCAKIAAPALVVLQPC